MIDKVVGGTNTLLFGAYTWSWGGGWSLKSGAMFVGGFLCTH